MNPSSPFFVDWSEFWLTERPDHEWLIEPILAKGRGHSIFAGHKTGKSLVSQWMVAHLAVSDPSVIVIYLDYEMSEADLYERFADMGYGGNTDLSRLRYALLPPLYPLDTPRGAQELLQIIDAEQASHPYAHIVVVIDTTSRAFAGPENDSDTTRAFYRNTGIQLKQRGCTWARLDHAGKERARGQRGSSAKGDDVDVVWELKATPTGFLFKRDVARMAWIPEKVALRQITGSPYAIAFEILEDTLPAGTIELMSTLIDLGVPVETSVRKARLTLVEHGFTMSQAVLSAAVKLRKSGA